MEQLTKLLIIFCFMFFINMNAQNEKRFFITKDSVIINNPVVISIKNIDGMFIISEEVLINEGKINMNKLVEEGKAYLFSDELYRFLSIDELKAKPIYNECSFTETYNLTNELTIRRLDNKVNSFILCFTRVDFYNQRLITFDNGKTIFPKKKELQFYKILFPICK